MIKQKTDNSYKFGKTLTNTKQEYRARNALWMCVEFGHVIGLRAQAQKSFPRGTSTGTLQLLYELSYYTTSVGSGGKFGATWLCGAILVRDTYF